MALAKTDRKKLRLVTSDGFKNLVSGIEKSFSVTPRRHVFVMRRRAKFCQLLSSAFFEEEQAGLKLQLTLLA